jgi:glucan biosynthesis protein C
MVRSAERLYYLDNLKVFLTGLVILHHAFEPWATGGGMVPVAGQHPVLAVIMGINASYFMGLFFLMAGYFSYSSMQRRGPGRFCWARFVRLGGLALVYAIFINPLMHWLLWDYLDKDPGPYSLFWYQYLAGHFNYGHLWFVVLLLQLSFIYALYVWFKGLQNPLNPPSGPLTLRQANLGLLGLSLGLGAVTFLVRIWWPQDAWFSFMGLIQVEPAHVPQYLLLFWLGLGARKYNWLWRMPASAGWIWLVLAFVPTWIFAPFMLEKAFLGHGVSWAGLVSAFRESFMCLGIGAGLVAWFRGSFNMGGKFVRYLAGGAYTVYIIHVPVLIIVQYWLRDMPPFKGAPLTLLIALPVCWLLANHVVRRLPRLKPVLG